MAALNTQYAHNNELILQNAKTHVSSEKNEDIEHDIDIALLTAENLELLSEKKQKRELKNISELILKKKGIYLGINSCYMNSAIQFLSSIPELIYIFDISGSDEKFETNVNVMSEIYNSKYKKNIASILISFRDALKYIFSIDSIKDDTYRNLFLALDLKSENINTQQDSLHFISAILIILENISKFDVNNSLVKKCKIFIKNISASKNVEHICSSYLDSSGKVRKGNDKKIEHEIRILLNRNIHKNTSIQEYVNNLNISENVEIEDCGDVKKTTDSVRKIYKNVPPEGKIGNNVGDYEINLDKATNEIIGYWKIIGNVNGYYGKNNVYEMVPGKTKYVGDATIKKSYKPSNYVIFMSPEIVGNVTLDGEITFGEQQYVLISSIYYNGAIIAGHYLCQEYDKIGGKNVIKTFNDSSIIDGTGSYFDVNNKSVMWLYRLKDFSYDLVSENIKNRLSLFAKKNKLYVEEKKTINDVKNIGLNICYVRNRYINHHLGIFLYGTRQPIATDDILNKCMSIFVKYNVKYYITFNEQGHYIYATHKEKEIFNKICNDTSCHFYSLPVVDWNPPTLDILVRFWTIVDEYHENYYKDPTISILLHCTAGHGRTGFMIMSYIWLKLCKVDETHMPNYEIHGEPSIVNILNSSKENMEKYKLLKSHRTLVFLRNQIKRYHTDSENEIFDDLNNIILFIDRINIFVTALETYTHKLTL